MAGKFWAIIRISTGEIVRRFKKDNPSEPSDLDLRLIPVEHGAYPKIDVELEGIGYKEEILNNVLKITFLSFKINDGQLKPIEVARERK